MFARDMFLASLEKNRAGERFGVYSICSSHENVIEAGMKQALEDDSIVLIESTSNQVDQFGGYTGMKPPDFASYIDGIAEKNAFPKEHILLGGDHLGPNAWQKCNAEDAMNKSHVLVQEYVKAGYQKIHLDASMFLADDIEDRNKPLKDEIVAERAASLCQTAEATWKRYQPTDAPPIYVIGTDVPVPGGNQEMEDHVQATSPQDVTKTIEITREEFIEKDLGEAWDRVVGVVVQPGVEFGDDQVFDYQPEVARELSRKITSYPKMVFEAHSTDYQTETRLSALVEDHFCILKVGPWLTFAYREALFALAMIENELFHGEPTVKSQLRTVMEEVMLKNPKYWLNYYSGNDQEQYLKRSSSFSDRCRYYWPNTSLRKAKDRLFANLRKKEPPLSLLSQYLPEEYCKVREGRISKDPENLVRSRIKTVMGIYSRACGLSS